MGIGQSHSVKKAHATFRFGDGRTGDVGFAADVTVGLAGSKGQFTAFALDSDIPALLSKGALESLRGCLNFSTHELTLESIGKTVPLALNKVGH